MTQITACAATALPDGEAMKIEADDRTIALFHLDGAYFALDDRCSHGNASMSEGYIEDDGTVECPLHAARFCLKTGAALCQPATDPIRTYPVAVVDGMVCIDVPEAA